MGFQLTCQTTQELIRMLSNEQKIVLAHQLGISVRQLYNLNDENITVSRLNAIKAFVTNHLNDSENE